MKPEAGTKCARLDAADADAVVTAPALSTASLVDTLAGSLGSFAESVIGFGKGADVVGMRRIVFRGPIVAGLHRCLLSPRSLWQFDALRALFAVIITAKTQACVATIKNGRMRKGDVKKSPDRASQNVQAHMHPFVLVTNQYPMLC